jgi:hypothetical protein
MSAELSRLLDAERAPVAAPPSARQAVLARLATTLALPPPTGPGSGSGPAPAGAGPAGATGAAASGVGSAVKSFLVSHGVASALIFAVGAVAGAGIHAAATRLATPVAIVVPAPISSPAPVIVQPAPTEPIVVAPKAEEPVRPAPRPVRTAPVVASPAVAPSAPPPPPESDKDLAAERSLLEVARTAFSRGQPKDALDQLDLHERQFPTGRLSEEREALRVMALAASGKRQDARARAARFVQEHPDSLLRPAVEAAVTDPPATGQ